jgi:hypothetical protein
MARSSGLGMANRRSLRLIAHSSRLGSAPHGLYRPKLPSV